MFDIEFWHAGDDEVVAAIREWNAAESAAAARKLSAIAELTRRRCAEGDRAHWTCDDWDAAGAEVSAALGISHGRASGQMDFAMSLKLLPAVAALFWAGTLSARVAYAITWRTALVTDADVRGRLDKALAAAAGGWEALSQFKLEQAIDVWVDRIDPGALRRIRTGVRNREIIVGNQNPEAGTASVWGRLLSTDAAVLDRRLTEMAHAVCEDDPRTISQRRADALGALAAGAAHLACQCGVDDCPAATPDGRAASVVVHVLADEAALNAQPDPQMSGPQMSGPSETADPPSAGAGSAALVGGGVIPTPLLAALIRDGATVRHLRRPPLDAEQHYRPSRALAEFIRMRDLTCRFPGCDQPAEYCDIDHTIPWPLGPTHASNLNLKCRKHHLLKTFWGGPGGWHDRQYPDGTMIWTSPAGQTYMTRPGSRLLFPEWDTTTARIGAAATAEPAPDRGLMMPTRRSTREQNRANRIRSERALNDTHVAERNRPPPF